MFLREPQSPKNNRKTTVTPQYAVLLNLVHGRRLRSMKQASQRRKINMQCATTMWCKSGPHKPCVCVPRDPAATLQNTNGCSTLVSAVAVDSFFLMNETADETRVEAAGERREDMPHFLALSLTQFAPRSARRRARGFGGKHRRSRVLPFYP